MASVKFSSVIAFTAFASLASVNAFAKGEFKAGYQSARVAQPFVHQPVPETLREAVNQTKFKIGRAAGTAVRATRTVLGTGAQYTLVVGGAAALVAAITADTSWITHNPEIMNKGLEHAKDIADNLIETAKATATYAPYAGAAVGLAAGGYVATPMVKYMGKGIVRVWMRNGPAVDLGIGAFHYALSLAATHDPMYAAAVGGNAAFTSNIARWLTPGAEKLGPAMPSPRK